MKDVLGEALLSFRLLKIGGVMIFDDNWMRGVARATAAFEEALGDSLQVLHRDEVGTVRRLIGVRVGQGRRGKENHVGFVVGRPTFSPPHPEEMATTYLTVDARSARIRPKACCVCYLRVLGLKTPPRRFTLIDLLSALVLDVTANGEPQLKTEGGQSRQSASRNT